MDKYYKGEGAIEMTESPNEYRQELDRLIDAEIENVVDDEIRKATKELSDERKKAISEVIEEQKSLIREVVEERKKMILAKKEALRVAILK